VHLVGFIVRIQHDARYSECQINVWRIFILSDTCDDVVDVRICLKIFHIFSQQVLIRKGSIHNVLQGHTYKNLKNLNRGIE